MTSLALGHRRGWCLPLIPSGAQTRFAGPEPRLFRFRMGRMRRGTSSRLHTFGLAGRHRSAESAEWIFARGSSRTDLDDEQNPAEKREQF
jgi:hypothetical protein